MAIDFRRIVYQNSSAEHRNSNRFGTWEWVNDDRIVFFGWSIPLIDY